METINNLLHVWAENAMRQSMWAFLRFNQERNLTAPQVNSLIFIGRLGHSSVNDLAKRWGVTKAAASQIADKMVDQGWIDRTENPHDRRSRDLTLTPAGSKLAEEAQIYRHGWIDEFVKSLSAEDIKSIMPAFEILNQKMVIYNDNFEKSLAKRPHTCSD
ncbi:MAG TPA: MarR family transcriptional regulator [Anaerolineaceae bacterium]|nr:MarR family transcriptional regulator [Anaerolineaceae bacterium]